MVCKWGVWKRGLQMALRLLALRATMHGEVGCERKGWWYPGRAREKVGQEVLL